jgi:hypothetical protein
MNMIDEKDIQFLQSHFDDRYKRIDDCTSDMNDAKKEHTQIFVDVATLKAGQRVNNWLTAAIAGGIIALVIKVFLGG